MAFTYSSLRAPRRLWRDISIGASVDDIRDLAAEAIANSAEHRLTALVFDGVVQQSGNRGVLITAGLDHQRGDCEKMPDVGYVGSLASLRTVDLAGESKSSGKYRSQSASNCLGSLEGLKAQS